MPKLYEKLVLLRNYEGETEKECPVARFQPSVSSNQEPFRNQFDDNSITLTLQANE